MVDGLENGGSRERYSLGEAVLLGETKDGSQIELGDGGEEN